MLVGALLTTMALADEPSSVAPPAAPVEAPPPKKKGAWFGNIRYGVGFALSSGGGLGGAGPRPEQVTEIAAFELRSYFTPRFAWHTTLNVASMVAPAVMSRDGRIDYALHVAAHLPLRPGLEVVIGPGAQLAYSYTHSGFKRFAGDVRLGLDWTERSGVWTTGLYLRPYAGWGRLDASEEAAFTGGVLAEIVGVVRLPKKVKRPR